MVSAGKVMVLLGVTLTAALLAAVGAVEVKAAVLALPPVVAPMLATLPVMLLAPQALLITKVGASVSMSLAEQAPVPALKVEPAAVQAAPELEALAGGVTVAVLVKGPVRPAGTMVVTVYVTDAPTGKSTVALMAPEPLAAPQTPPLVALPQLQLEVTTPAGSGSVTTAPATPNGPALLTTMV